MPFDPTLPVTDSEMKSAEMRDQFNGLKDLIDGQSPLIATLSGRCDGLDANVATLTANVASLTGNIAALTTRVTLLEQLVAYRTLPATLTVTGFGRADVNGVYTQIANVNGAPAWELLGAPTRVRILWNTFYPNFWTIKMDGSYDLYKCLTFTGTYTATYGTAPGGTVA